jgi:hypothetical protein
MKLSALGQSAERSPRGIFRGIEPVIAKKMLAFRRADRRIYAICRHGVVCFHKLEITPPSNFNHSRYATLINVEEQ